MSNLIQKKKTLKSLLADYNSLAVAFSGGVDSTFLLACANEIFQDNDKLIAITAASPIHQEKDLKLAQAFTKKFKIKHLILHSSEMDFAEFKENSPDRCYVCKNINFKKIIDEAKKHGIDAVAHGINVDDQKEFRPGLKASKELNILAPLTAAGLTKNDIRQLSKEMGLAVWDKPSSGCLATRIPYGEIITLEKLKMIENAEIILFDMGFNNCRVRYYNELAKIEVPSDSVDQFLKTSIRENIVKEFRKIGFLYIALDLEGYHSGTLNRSIMSESDIS